ncbi:MAG: aromatic ring-hydroxylating dioxygenase subunit alpha [Dongiaceae bacterium]
MNIALADAASINANWLAPKETLPGWAYSSAEFFALEKEHLFLSNWQIVCHVSELPNPGAYVTLDLLGERAVAVRGEDGEIRAFYNVCRHRAAAVVKGRSGSCRHALRCPYHGWTYGLDGALKAVPGEKSFPGLDKPGFGLTQIEAEVWMGFVFVRFRAGGPSVAERMAHYAPELAPYRFADMIPAGDIWKTEPGVDWKNVMDNYLEGYHVPVGHPGLYRLFGVGYETDVKPGHVSRAMHWLHDTPSENWTEGRYQALLPEIDHLPAARRRAWAYYTLLPNIAFDVYPDQIDFFHVVPTAPGKCRIRSRAYRLPNPSPTLKAVQYLNWRINAQVQYEDEELIRSVQEGLGSESYGSGILSEKEMCLAQMHDYVRSVLPVATLPEPPAPGTMAAVNAAMIKEAA